MVMNANKILFVSKVMVFAVAAFMPFVQGNGIGDGIVFQPLNAPTLPYVTEYTIPTSDSNPLDIAINSNGTVFFTENIVDKIGKMTESGSFTEYSLPPNSHPQGIAINNNGTIFYANTGTYKIGKMTEGGSYIEYPTPSNIVPYEIAINNNGTIFFTAYNSNRIGKMTESGSFTIYPLPADNYSPIGISVNGNGSVYFTEYYSDKIGKMTESGSFTLYAIPLNSYPQGITINENGTIFYGNTGTYKIGKMTESGSYIEYSIPSNSAPFGITVDDNNTIYYANYGEDCIGKMTESGCFTEYAIPRNTAPSGICVNGNGTVFFTESTANQIGKLEFLSPPQVSGTSPTDGEENVELDAVINTTFDTEIDSEQTLTDIFTIIPNVSGEYAISDNLYSVIFTPDTNLDADTEYTMIVSGDFEIRGSTIDGNSNGTSEGSPIDDYTFTFTTVPSEIPPSVDENSIHIRVIEVGQWNISNTNPVQQYTTNITEISARIKGADGIDHAKIYWYFTASTSTAMLTEMSEVDMDKESGTYENGIWSGQIPAQDETGTVYYHIEAQSGEDVAVTTTAHINIVTPTTSTTEPLYYGIALWQWVLVLILILVVAIFYIVRIKG
jgi:virginiamycin B lyase